jgi:hypothetical protein
MESRDDRPRLHVSSQTAEAPFRDGVRLYSRRAPSSQDDRIDTRQDSADRQAEAENRPDRLLEMRRRVASNYYDNPDVVDEVARRILERGDL